MEADGVLPGSGKPVTAELVHHSGRTRITRLVVPGGTVIRKEPLGPDGERRVRHEVAMLERPRGVARVAGPAAAKLPIAAAGYPPRMLRVYLTTADERVPALRAAAANGGNRTVQRCLPLPVINILTGQDGHYWRFTPRRSAGGNLPRDTGAPVLSSVMMESLETARLWCTDAIAAVRSAEDQGRPESAAISSERGSKS